MKVLKVNISIIILILFEAAVGILLLVNPEAFTRMIIILFGIILLAIGVTYLIQYLLEKKEDINNPLFLLIAIVALTIGAVCSFCSGAIIGLITAIAIIYGVILIILGIYKLHNYHCTKKAGFPVSKISFISGAIAVILGIVITVYPKNAALSIWQLAGIMLIIEAVIDFISIIQMIRAKDSKQEDNLA